MPKTIYLLFCDHCGAPNPITIYILHDYIAIGVDGVYCDNCGTRIFVSEYLRKIAGEL